MEAQIQIRRSTAAQWISANPILAAGEPGLETDTGKGKYGDGTTRWVTLGYSWSPISAGPTGTAGGSLSGTYPNPSLATATVGASQIIDASVGTAELANNAVTSVKIADANVSTAKIVDANVTLVKLASASVDSSKIVDGSIALADLATATVSGLKVDVADEGTVVQTDVDQINFVGAGVAASGAAGVATVTITGGASSSLVAGTMVDWYDPVPPTGWYLCDGTVHADLAGTLGTRYGASSGTVPNFAPQVVDRARDTTIGDALASTQSGWRVDVLTTRVSANLVHLYFQFTRTGANIPLTATQFADIAVFTLKSDWLPDIQIGGSMSNGVRTFYMGINGIVTLSSGLATSSTANANINTNDVFVGEVAYMIGTATTFPKTYKVIKAP